VANSVYQLFSGQIPNCIIIYQLVIGTYSLFLKDFHTSEGAWDILSFANNSYFYSNFIPKLN
jgi:hypothetical protein